MEEHYQVWEVPKEETRSQGRGEHSKEYCKYKIIII